MLRMIRVECSSAMYHVMDRGDRREGVAHQRPRGGATKISIRWPLLDGVEERPISGPRLSPPSPASYPAMALPSLSEFASRVHDQLYGHILPFWTGPAIDHEQGGWLAWLSNDLSVDRAQPKGLILNSRI